MRHAEYNRRYTIFDGIVDIALTMLTGGLWLIYIAVRELRLR